ncbi:MAG: hypothetical protein AAF827_05130 [Cyanobacteria bacterium P01_D01_bin.6]
MAEYVRDEGFDFCGPCPPLNGWYWGTINAWSSHSNPAWKDAHWLVIDPDELPF